MPVAERAAAVEAERPPRAGTLSVFEHARSRRVGAALRSVGAAAGRVLVRVTGLRGEGPSDGQVMLALRAEMLFGRSDSLHFAKHVRDALSAVRTTSERGTSLAAIPVATLNQLNGQLCEIDRRGMSAERADADAICLRLMVALCGEQPSVGHYRRCLAERLEFLHPDRGGALATDYGDPVKNRNRDLLWTLVKHLRRRAGDENFPLATRTPSQSPRSDPSCAEPARLTATREGRDRSPRRLDRPREFRGTR